jgi:hypothetical protein
VYPQKLAGREWSGVPCTDTLPQRDAVVCFSNRCVTLELLPGLLPGLSLRWQHPTAECLCPLAVLLQCAQCAFAALFWRHNITLDACCGTDNRVSAQ